MVANAFTSAAGRQNTSACDSTPNRSHSSVEQAVDPRRDPLAQADAVLDQLLADPAIHLPPVLLDGVEVVGDPVGAGQLLDILRVASVPDIVPVDCHRVPPGGAVQPRPAACCQRLGAARAVDDVTAGVRRQRGQRRACDEHLGFRVTPFRPQLPARRALLPVSHTSGLPRSAPPCDRPSTGTPRLPPAAGPQRSARRRGSRGRPH